MDAKSLEILEFPKVREILASYTSFSASRDLALSLKPSPDPETVALLLRQSAEARHLLSLQPGLSVGEVEDVRDPARMAAKGKVLEPQRLSVIKATLAGARKLRSNLARLAEQTPSLWAIAKQLVPLPDLEDKIGGCISAAGEVLDSASPKLSTLRHQTRETRQRLLERLGGIIKSPRSRRLIQEPLITEREGRYVIPVKVEMKRELKGIVHDVSGSGATVFVEPWATAEMGNELRQLVAEEKREVERILASLSAEVGRSEAAISTDIALLAELDLALAKARYAADVGALEPDIAAPRGNMPAGHRQSQGWLLRLVEARHPLLRGKAVPLSVEVGRDFSILVVTGPNTGGKTVALKTIGLLALMTQAGMPIPASEGSNIPVFDNVFADIGDEQSIEQTLSTFSWHMGNIVRIIRNSTTNSLILLDELGTSTDPGEGAALARAILLHFLSRGTMTVATTHYSDLKVLAHSTAGMQNASLDFDSATLAPTYHLTVGIPGGSNAMAIASQLGLPAEIIAAARETLGKATQEVGKLLQDLMAERQRSIELREGLERERRAAEVQKRSLEDERRRLEEQERTFVQETRERLMLEAARLQKQIRQATAEMRKASSAERVEIAKKTLADARKELARQAWQTSQEGPPGKPTAPHPVALGDRVWLNDLGLWGNVVSLLDGHEVEVQVGNARLRLGREDVVRTASPGETPPDVAVVKKELSGRRASLELDLRGKRAAEIEAELDSYLNDAFLAHLVQVRVIHGAGTGTVRQVVRDTLASHPLVKAFRPGGRGEGGDGVTVVDLLAPG